MGTSKSNEFEILKNEIPEWYGGSSYTVSNNRYYAEYYNIHESDSILEKIKYYKFRDFNPQEYQRLPPNYDINDMDESQRRKEEENYSRSSKLIKTLEPPAGQNIFHVIKNSETCQNAFRDLLQNFSLKLLINKNLEELQIVKEDDGILHTLPLYSLADTLQTMLFYRTTILSNRNSVLVFEEPESHTFPFYTSLLGEYVAEDETNQFFIATHNPYFFKAIYAKAKQADLQINLVRYDKNQTIVHQLSKAQVSLLFEDDMFMTLSHFDDWPKSIETQF